MKFIITHALRQVTPRHTLACSHTSGKAFASCRFSLQPFTTRLDPISRSQQHVHHVHALLVQSACRPTARRRLVMTTRHGGTAEPPLVRPRARPGRAAATPGERTRPRRPRASPKIRFTTMVKVLILLVFVVIAVHARESLAPWWRARRLAPLFSQLLLFRLEGRGTSRRREHATSTHQHWCARSFLGLAGRDDHFFVETFFS